MNSKTKPIYDAIIIGSGLAGLIASINFAKQEKKVLLLCKGELAENNTSYAQGGIASVWSPHDSASAHMHDTLIAGAHHNNPEAVKFIIQAGPETIQELISLGVHFTQQEHPMPGEPPEDLSQEGGHHRRRILHVKDQTGKALIETLLTHVKNHPNITIQTHTYATRLLTHQENEKNICYGVETIHKEKFEHYFAKKTILATGGIGNLFAKTTNPPNATGDGIALAHNAGAKLQDIEFIQFHPTALDTNEHPLLLITEAIRGEGAYLLNEKHERFMKTVHPQAELAPRDIVARAIYNERLSGQVYLDIRHLNAQEFSKKYPYILEQLNKRGFNPTQDLIPITPAAHYLCGGIKTNLLGETNIPGLYAIGEVGATGLHGANRLASNSLLEAAVMGKQVTKSTFEAPPPPEFPLPNYIKTQPEPRVLLAIQNGMWDHLGLRRDTSSLGSFLEQLQLLSLELPIPTDLTAWQDHHIHTVAECITKAALARTTSLGCHFIEV